MIDIIFLFFTGFFTGIFASLLGIGGGVLFLPLTNFYYINYLKYPVEFLKILIGSSSFNIFTNSLLSIKKHYKNITVKLIPVFFISTIIGSQLGGFLSYHLESNVLKKLIGVFFIISSILVYLKKDEENSEDIVFSKKQLIALFFVSFFISTIASMMGIGGGVFMIPVLYKFFNMNIKKIPAVNTLFTLFVSINSVIFYLLHSVNLNGSYSHLYIFGMISFKIVIISFIGGILGVEVGALLLKKLNIKYIKYIFIVLLFLSGIQIIL